MQKLLKRKTFNRFLRTVLLLICISTIVLPNLQPTAKAISQSDIDALQEDANKLASQKKNLQSKLSALSDDKSEVLEKKELLDEQISVLSDQVSNVEAQIADYDNLISQTQAQLDEAKEKEAAQYQLFCKRVRAMVRQISVTSRANHKNVTFEDVPNPRPFL